MKLIKFRLLSIVIIFVLSAILLVTVTIAWFSNINSINTDVIGKTRSSYFGGGVGTETNPYLISTHNHFYNLSYLQNMGYINDNTFFEVTNDIDFANALEVHKTIIPIGNTAHKFNSTFKGNNYVIKGYSVNGAGLQDIGTFGYIGPTGKVTNLILDSPMINSNPTSIELPNPLHSHDEANLNMSTGYIAGHMANGGILDRVYVIAPTINSLTSAYLNRSQYGLIGYSEADGGIVGGVPLNQRYSFNLNSSDAQSKIRSFMNNHSNNYRVSSSGALLSTVFGPASGNVLLDIKSGFSLSTLKVVPNPQTTPATPATYFYDEMKAKNLPIGIDTQAYSRDNIDVVGPVSFLSNGLNIQANKSHRVPAIGNEFVVTNYPESILLYVRALNSDTFGFVTTTFEQGGGSLVYKCGWNDTGTVYQPSINNEPRAVIIANGTAQEINKKNAFTAIKKSTVDNKFYINLSEPEFYVYLLNLSNGQTRFSNLYFEYNPAQALTTISTDDIKKMQNVDFIIDKTDIPANMEANSLVNFGYDLTNTQKLSITTKKLAGQTTGSYIYQFTIDYQITDNSYLYIYIINLKNTNRSVEIKYGSTTYTVTEQIIEIKISSAGGIVLTKRNLPPPA